MIVTERSTIGSRAVFVESAKPLPPSVRGVRKLFALTALSGLAALLAIPALVLWILSLLSILLAPIGIGVVLANLTVPATGLLTGLHRRLVGAVLGADIQPGYAPINGRDPIARCGVWFVDPARWRDFAFLAVSSTGSFVLSLLTVSLLAAPIAHLIIFLVVGGWLWFSIVLFAPVMGVVWWATTPALVRARASIERGILGSRTTELARRVEQVTESRTESLDHSAAEVRRIERDLHDGAQARIVSLGMQLGMAEQLVESDPAAATSLMQEARAATVTALEDLRSVVRGIHPPVLADRGLSGVSRHSPPDYRYR